MKNEKFIEKAKEVHNGFYKYDKVEYIKSDSKVIITCPIHGDFEQKPLHHLQKMGCPKCAKDSKKLTFEKFISVFNEYHENKYELKTEIDANKVYLERNEQLAFFCNEHNKEFSLSVNSLLLGRCCTSCMKVKKPEQITLDKCYFKNREEFEEYLIENENKKKLIFKDLSFPIKSTSIIKFTCPIHGDFKQNGRNFFVGKGCPKCSLESTVMGNEKFIEKANIIHNNFYNYDKTIYTKTNEKVIITCPIHGDFEQKPIHHLQKMGCPKCAKDSKKRN